MKNLLTVVLVILFKIPFCQTIEYKNLSYKADSLFLNQQYEEAITFYEEAFLANKDMGSVFHRYRAASCYAILNKKDSSFHHFFRIAEKGKFSQLELISNDFNFKNLYSDKRWYQVLQIIDKNEKEKEKNGL